MILLPNAKIAAGSHPRLALKHQAQRTQGAEAPSKAEWGARFTGLGCVEPEALASGGREGKAFCNRIIHPPAEERYVASACEITTCQVVYECHVV